MPTSKTYEPATIYDVRIARPVSTAGVKLLPRQRHEMTGVFLNDLVAREGADVVSDASAR